MESSCCQNLAQILITPIRAKFFPPIEVLASFCIVALEIRFSLLKYIRHPMLARDDHSTDSSNEAFLGVVFDFSFVLE